MINLIKLPDISVALNFFAYIGPSKGLYLIPSSLFQLVCLDCCHYATFIAAYSLDVKI